MSRAGRLLLEGYYEAVHVTFYPATVKNADGQSVYNYVQTGSTSFFGATGYSAYANFALDPGTVSPSDGALVATDRDYTCRAFVSSPPGKEINYALQHPSFSFDITLAKELRNKQALLRVRMTQENFMNRYHVVDNVQATVYFPNVVSGRIIQQTYPKLSQGPDKEYQISQLFYIAVSDNDRDHKLRATLYFSDSVTVPPNTSEGSRQNYRINLNVEFSIHSLELDVADLNSDSLLSTYELL